MGCNSRGLSHLGLGKWHRANFLNYLRSRVASNATVEKDLRAALVLHMTNLCFRHKRPARWDVAQKKVEV